MVDTIDVVEESVLNGFEDLFLSEPNVDQLLDYFKVENDVFLRGFLLEIEHFAELEH